MMQIWTIQGEHQLERMLFALDCKVAQLAVRYSDARYL